MRCSTLIRGEEVFLPHESAPHLREQTGALVNLMKQAT